MALLGIAPNASELQGSFVVIGRGPERAIIEQLAQAFEKTFFGSAVDIRWNRNFHIVSMLASGDADVAVSGREEPDLVATTVAWDGLAIVVNFSNPVKEMTKEQVASLFSGKIRDWSELDEKAHGKIQVVLRPDDQNLNAGLAQSLNIVGQMTKNAEYLRSDQQLLSRVSGQGNAVGYVSLQTALDAMTYGVPIRILLISGVEPGIPTITSGQYPLRRPVVLMTRKNSTAISRQFVEFTKSAIGQSILASMYVPVT